MVTIFTGPSGLDSDKIIKNFISKYPFTPQEKPKYFKIENLIGVAYRADKKLRASLSSNEVWKKFLREPYKLQERYWVNALDSICKKIEEFKEADNNAVIFINLHACYFHRKTFEYLSLVNIESLKKLKPQKIITLIDDIYDMHHRLGREPDDIFYPSVAVTSIDIILEYLRILDWRSKEIMMSRFIAKTIDCPNYVFPIKHNWDIFYNLVYDKQPTAYLSHPISEVRRLETKGKTDLANRIKSEIDSISNELRQYFTVFLPTTIDEFRIKKEKKEKSEIFYTVLSERWENDHYEEPKNMLYACSGFNGTNELWKQEKSDFPNQDLNSLLKILNDNISAQVTTRDYILVEQSKFLIVYRPLFNGNQSGGVEKESSYHKDLIRATELLGSEKSDSPKYFVYCPIEDINLYKRNTFNYYIEDRIKKSVLVCRDGAYSTISDDEFNTLLTLNGNKDDLIEFLKKVLHNHKIQITDDPDFKSKSPLKDNEEIVSDIYNKIMDDYLINIVSVINLYKELVNEFPEHSIFDVKKFITQIVEKIQK